MSDTPTTDDRATETPRHPDHLAELHRAARDVVESVAGFDWVAVNRDALNKLRRLLDGNAPPTTDADVTIDRWMTSEMRRLSEFIAWRRAGQNGAHPNLPADAFPREMPAGEWDEHYRAWGGPPQTNLACRRQRQLLGLYFPKSNCHLCGSILRPNWSCPLGPWGEPPHVGSAVSPPQLGGEQRVGRQSR